MIVVQLCYLRPDSSLFSPPPPSLSLCGSVLSIIQVTARLVSEEADQRRRRKEEEEKEGEKKRKGGLTLCDRV